MYDELFRKDAEKAAHQRLIAEGWFVYRFTDGSIRFMCSWATTEADVDALLDSLRRIA